MKSFDLWYLFRERTNEEAAALVNSLGRINEDYFLGYAPFTLMVGALGSWEAKHILDGYCWVICVNLGPAPPSDLMFSVFDEERLVDLGKLLNGGRAVTKEEARAVCPGLNAK